MTRNFLNATLLLTALACAAPAQAQSREREVWLGVVVEPVPQAVRAQLELERNQGVMVRNVVVDSPADQAGLQQYDVIVEVDGDKVERNHEQFAALINEHEPGDEIDLRVLRSGEVQTLEATLADPPRQQHTRRLRYEEPRFDTGPRQPLVLRDRLRWSDRDGWHWPADHGDPRTDEFDRIAAGDDLLKLDPREPLDLVLHQDNGRIELHQDARGQFTVVHSEEGEMVGRGARREYRDLTALRDGDPKAYALYLRITRPAAAALPAPQPAPGRWDLPGRVEREPDYIFQVDGPEITVHVRRGDSQLTRTFNGEAALREQAPALWQKYRDLHMEE